MEPECVYREDDVGSLKRDAFRLCLVRLSAGWNPTDCVTARSPPLLNCSFGGIVFFPLEMQMGRSITNSDICTPVSSYSGDDWLCL